jgi:MFS family permease
MSDKTDIVGSESSVWLLLRRGPFARYMAGEAISMTGTWMQVMAQSWVMAGLTDRAFLLGLVNLAGGLPMVALTMVGGVVADRHDKRYILVLTQVVQIVLALGLGLLIGAGQIQVWHVVVMAAVLGVSNSFEMPAAASLVPELVQKDQVARAIAIDRSVFHGTRLIGPALAGYVVGVWGPALAFYCNAVSFLALIAALLTLHPRPRSSDSEEAQRRGRMSEGWAFVRADSPSMAMIGLMATTTVFVFPVMMVMLPLYVKNVLQLGPDRMGVLMGAAASGSLAGAIGLLAVAKRRRWYVLLGACLGTSLALTLLSRTRQFEWAALGFAMLSLGVSSLVGLANTIVQERAPSPLRGRISAVVGLSFFGLMPFAGLGIPSLADWLGISTALGISAGIYGAITLIILTRLARVLLPD